jgi:hypothetical protein
MRSAKQRALSLARFNRLRDLSRAGASLEEAAGLFGCSTRNIRKIVEKHTGFCSWPIGE